MSSADFSGCTDALARVYRRCSESGIMIEGEGF